MLEKEHFVPSGKQNCGNKETPLNLLAEIQGLLSLHTNMNQLDILWKQFLIQDFSPLCQPGRLTVLFGNIFSPLWLVTISDKWAGSLQQRYNVLLFQRLETGSHRVRWDVPAPRLWGGFCCCLPAFLGLRLHHSQCSLPSHGFPSSLCLSSTVTFKVVLSTGSVGNSDVPRWAQLSILPLITPSETLFPVMISLTASGG